MLSWFEEWHMFVKFGIDANKLMSIITYRVRKLHSRLRLLVSEYRDKDVRVFCYRAHIKPQIMGIII